MFSPVRNLFSKGVQMEGDGWSWWEYLLQLSAGMDNYVNIIDTITDYVSS